MSFNAREFRKSNKTQNKNKSVATSHPLSENDRPDKISYNFQVLSNSINTMLSYNIHVVLTYIGGDGGGAGVPTEAALKLLSDFAQSNAARRRGPVGRPVAVHMRWENGGQRFN
ncbi:unnamed protein product [Leptosia nina]|uniref:Uncharacterized protein n=1 Tax=Leptosia nina TaxID=320188 RepID=A0AAV1J9C9_9NEOP